MGGVAYISARAKGWYSIFLEVLTDTLCYVIPQNNRLQNEFLDRRSKNFEHKDRLLTVGLICGGRGCVYLRHFIFSELLTDTLCYVSLQKNRLQNEFLARGSKNFEQKDRLLKVGLAPRRAGVRIFWLAPMVDILFFRRESPTLFAKFCRKKLVSRTNFQLAGVKTSSTKIAS